MAGITINPVLVKNAANTFYSTSEGGVQGALEDDPVARFYIASGIVGPGVSTPMWGANGITDSLTTAGTEAQSIRSVLTLASSQSNLTGFTVFNQSLAMLQSVQSPVPLAAATMGINFVRFGSGARLWVGASSGACTALAGGASNTAVYWDYTNQVLLTSPGGTAIAAKVLDIANGTAQTVTYSSGTGFATWNYAGFAVLIQI